MDIDSLATPLQYISKNEIHSTIVAWLAGFPKVHKEKPTKSTEA